MQAAVPVAGGVAQPGGVPPPPPQVAGPAVPAPQSANYRELYSLPDKDPYNGNYVNLYQGYETGTTTPLELRNSLFRDGNNGTYINLLVHVRSPTLPPDEPGHIVVYHRVTRKDTRFGQVALSYENVGLAYFGDVLGGQTPTTVVIPDLLFNSLPVIQVPTGPRLQQLMAADPAAVTFGPFQAGDPDVTPVTTRPAMIVPNAYAAPFLTSALTPLQAYTTLLGLITQDGNNVACEGLLDWLRATVTLRNAAGQPRTAVSPLVPPVFHTPTDQQSFAAYRLGIMHGDLPHTQPGVYHNSALVIAQGINDLAQEQRLARQEATAHRDNKAAPKTPADYFGVLLERLMRWCLATTEADLPPIYELIANTKKGKIRLALQTAIEDALHNLNYNEEFPISAALANKIVELKWSSQLREDFTVGLNIFCLGSVDDEVMEDQRRLNQHFDAVAGGDAAPSLMDMVTLQDGKQDLFIPKTLAQLRYSVERSHALWHVLLGAGHPITVAHRRYRESLVAHEKRLERVIPRDPRYLHLVPALLARRTQVTVNYWLLEQLHSPQPITFEGLHTVFADIECDRPWEPSFPSRYVNTPASDSYPAAITVGGSPSLAGTSLSGSNSSTPSNPSTAPSTVPTPNAPAPAKPPKAAIVRNPDYKNDLFAEYKAKGIKTGRLRDALYKRNRTQIPKNSAGNPMCIPWHIIGMCNERCNSIADHAPHSDQDDQALATWCAEHYHLD